VPARGAGNVRIHLRASRLPCVTRTSVLAIVACALSLAGCGSDTKERSAPTEQPVRTFADPLLEQKERARREVETVTGERKGNLDQAIDGADR
jgi:hypothetical protein